jgi:arylsulfatase A-like enzyme
VRTEPVTHCDVHRTLLEHAGVDVPADQEPPGERSLPGRSFGPLLSGQSMPGWPDRVFGEYGPLRMVRTERYKLIRRFPEGPDELFDLVSDPREARNAIGDIERAPVVADLDDSMTAFFDSHADPRRDGLRASALPRHNSEEAWRDTGPRGIVETPDWLVRAQADADGDQ